MDDVRLEPAITYSFHVDIACSKHLERLLIKRPFFTSIIATTILAIVDLRLRQSHDLRNFTVECHHEISRDACRWCIYLEVVLAEYGSHRLSPTFTNSHSTNSIILQQGNRLYIRNTIDRWFCAISGKEDAYTCRLRLHRQRKVVISKGRLGTRNILEGLNMSKVTPVSFLAILSFHLGRFFQYIECSCCRNTIERTLFEFRRSLWHSIDSLQSYTTDKGVRANIRQRCRKNNILQALSLIECVRTYGL